MIEICILSYYEHINRLPTTHTSSTIYLQQHSTASQPLIETQSDKWSILLVDDPNPIPPCRTPPSSTTQQSSPVRKSPFQQQMFRNQTTTKINPNLLVQLTTDTGDHNQTVRSSRPSQSAPRRAAPPPSHSQSSQLNFSSIFRFGQLRSYPQLCGEQTAIHHRRRRRRPNPHRSRSPGLKGSAWRRLFFAAVRCAGRYACMRGRKKTL